MSELKPCPYQDGCPVIDEDTHFVTINGYLLNERCDLCKFENVPKEEYPCVECRDNYDTKYKGDIRKVFEFVIGSRNDFEEG